MDAIVCDTTDPASLGEVRGLFPHHLDTIVNVPAPSLGRRRPTHLLALRDGQRVAQLRWTRRCFRRC